MWLSIEKVQSKNEGEPEFDEQQLHKEVEKERKQMEVKNPIYSDEHNQKKKDH